MRVLVALIAFVAAVGFVGAPLSEAAKKEKYATAPVSNGGTVSGKISFKGAVPAPETFALAKFPNAGFCGKVDSKDGTRFVQRVNVKDGALGDVVVFIKGITSGKEFNFTEATAEADGCRFLVTGGPSTLTGVVVVKKNIKVTNNDADPTDPKAASGVLHNPHGYAIKGPKSSTMFNLPLPEKGQSINKKVIIRQSGSYMMIECDQHNYMRAFFQPVDNPYYAVVGADGTFTIDQVPPGDYEIGAFHPTLGTQTAKITVGAGGKVTSDFSFSPK